MTYSQEQLIELQLDRELYQQQEGRERFERSLTKDIKGDNYSNTPGGKAATHLVLENCADHLKGLMDSTRDRAGTDHATVARIYRNLLEVPLLDLDTGLPRVDKDGEVQTFKLWDDHVAVLMGLTNLLDNCKRPILTDKSENKRGGQRRTVASLQHFVGENLQQELIILYLKAHFPDRRGHLGFISRLMNEQIRDKASAAQKTYNFKRLTRSYADYFENQGMGVLSSLFNWQPWSESNCTKIGSKILQAVVTGSKTDEYGLLFCTESSPERIRTANWKPSNFPTLTQAGEMFLDKFDDLKLNEAQIKLPMLCEPRDHELVEVNGQVVLHPGGYLQPAAPKLRNTVSGEWKGELSLSQKHVDLLNNMQGQKLRINQFILGVMEEVKDLSGTARWVGDFKPMIDRDAIVTHRVPDALEGLPRSNPKVKEHVATIRDQHNRYEDKYVKESRDARTMDLLQAARYCKDDEAFYLPTYSDFRGRSYSRTELLSYQGSDPSKALIEWAEGAPVDEHTSYLLLLELSGFMGLDKANYVDRVSAVLEYEQEIRACVADPIGNTWWRIEPADGGQVEKPWQWLATAKAWVDVVDGKVTHTHARVSVDATCSGLQFFAGFTKSGPTAHLVNLTNNPDLQDSYTALLDAALKRIEDVDRVITYKSKGKTATVPKDKIDALFTDVPEHRAAIRKGAKGILMTGMYGAGHDSRKGTFSKKTKLLSLPKEQQQFTTAEGNAIYNLAFKPAQSEVAEAMDVYLEFIQTVVRDALTTGTKDKEWKRRIDPATGEPRDHIVIPMADGSLLKQLYRIPKFEKVKTSFFGDARKKKHDESWLVSNSDLTDIDAQIRSTAANFTHAQDGATLVLALHDCKVPFTCTHDSVAGRANGEMLEINQRLRRALYEVFTSDVIPAFVELNGLDPDEYQLKDFGTYDPAEVLQSTYSYC